MNLNAYPYFSHQVQTDELQVIVWELRQATSIT